MPNSQTVTLKYPARISGIYYEAGTVVKVAKIEDVRRQYPNIHYSENSTAVAVKFRKDLITFVHCDQIER